MRILRINKTRSTNDYILKYVKRKEDTIVVAESQTNGRGTKGRSFSSEKGGIYLSMLKFYYDFDPSNAFLIIQNVSVAIVKTLLAFNVNAKIKWPNDILVDGKKICGILTENCIDNGLINYSIIGIGLNVLNEIPKELESLAISMKEVCNKVDFESVLMTLIFNLSSSSSFEDYKQFSCVINKKVEVYEGNKPCYNAIIADILPDGRIKLDNGRLLSSAEVKLKV